MQFLAKKKKKRIFCNYVTIVDNSISIVRTPDESESSKAENTSMLYF